MLKRPLVGIMAASVVIFIVSVACIQFSAQTNSVVAIWPANAILLAVFLRNNPNLANYTMSVVGGGSALILAELASRDISTTAAGFVLANLVEVIAAASMLRILQQGIPDFTSIQGLATFLIIASVLAPIMSATIAAATASATDTTKLQSVWMTWYVANALGMAIVGPFALVLNVDHWREIRDSTGKFEIVGILVLIVLVTLAASYYRLLLILAVPIILISTFRFGVLGAAAAILWFAFIGTVFIITGIGFPVLSQPDVAQRIIGLQILLVANVVWALPVAALLSEKKRLVAQVYSDNFQLKGGNVRKSQMLIELRRKLTNAEEAERLRLARELHDRTGQAIAIIMLELKQIAPFVSTDGRDRLGRLFDLLGQMGKTLHRIAWQLRPMFINGGGLAQALRNYISEWNRQLGVEVDFYCGEEAVDRLPDEIQIAVYRIVQEALTNISKHASATIVSVVIKRVENVLHLTVEDDGCGFDPEKCLAENQMSIDGGLGLAGIRERVAMLRGETKIQSFIGGGTTIFARIPLNVSGTEV